MTDPNADNSDTNSELYIRDFCGKSIKLITNYYYYNYYNQKDFNYKISDKEKTLLNIIEGKGNFMNYLISILPFIIFIIFGIVYLFAFISFWFSICCPIDCCKKNKIICKKKIFLILFHCFSIVIIIFGILTMLYINLLKMDIHGMVCSLNLLIYNIKNGQGLIKKKEFEKPLWLNLNELENLIEQASTPLLNLDSPCDQFITHYSYPAPSTLRNINEKKRKISFSDNFESIFQLSEISHQINDFENKLNLIYSTYKESILYYNGVAGNGIKPLYIKNLGPISNRTTYLGKIYSEFNNNIVYSAKNYFKIIYGYCSMFSNIDSSSYTSSLGDVSGFTLSLKNSLDNISKSIINKISKYIDDYENILFMIYEIFLILFLFLIVLINIVFFFYIKNNYKITRKCIIIFWVIVNFLIVILFILSSVFGIFSYVFNDVGDILDYLFSNENLISESPSLIGDDISAVKNCLTPNGDLLNEYLGDDAEDAKEIIELFNAFYNLKYKISNESSLYSSSEKNSRNTLFTMNNFLSELDDFNEDIVLTTNLNNNGNYAVENKFNELNKYTYAGTGTYQDTTCSKYFDYWVSTFNRCPSSIENQCKLLGSTYNYNDACAIQNADYPTVQAAAFQLIEELKNYKNENSILITQIKKEITPLTPAETNNLETLYKKLITLMKKSLEDSIPIIDIVYNVFYKYINNDPIENPDNYEDPKVNIFSFLNCSSFGRDLNITIFIIKQKLTHNFLNVSILNYIMNFITIFISILVVFILNLYKNEEEDENKKNDKNEKNVLINNEEIKNNVIYKDIYSEKENSLNKSNNKLKIDNSNHENNDNKNIFLMNKIDNNNLMNIVSNPVNVEINKNNDYSKNNNNYLGKISENSKENEYLKENQNYKYDDSF